LICSGSFVASLFQSTPLREGRPIEISGPVEYACFNPRPCARGDGPHSTHLRQRDVSIHAPARGATGSRRRERPGRTVSIHAPARGATRFLQLYFHLFGVSIHAPARGATLVITCLSSTDDWFQSTPLREGRRVPRGRLSAGKGVSIHAPARGATQQHGRGYGC